MEAAYVNTTQGTHTSFSVAGGGGGANSEPTGYGQATGPAGVSPGGGDGGTREHNGRTIAGSQGGGSVHGGGGGGVGWIRLNYFRDYLIPNGGNSVPNPGDAVTTYTIGRLSAE